MPLDPIFAPTQLGVHTVPGIWRYMLPEDVFYFKVDPEKQSSCFDCPQVKKHNFHPSIRCCAFIPRIPNFLLGMSLQSEKTEAMVRQFIEAGYSLPEGTQLSPGQLVESLEHISPAHTNDSIVCPFLDLTSKQCRMYAFRNGVCSTFFCIHDRGAEGALFWEHLQDLVSQIETALSQWALAQLGFDLDDYFQRFNDLSRDLEACNNNQNNSWSAAARQTLFQNWFGREAELYRATADVIIRHKHELYALACQQKLYQSKVFDQTSRHKLAASFAEKLILESLPDGEPEKIESIWYSVQLAQRNLQLSRQTHPHD